MTDTNAKTPIAVAAITLVREDAEQQVRVKADQVAKRAARFKEIQPPRADEDAIDEVLPERRIPEPSLIDHGEQGVLADEGCGEDAAAAPARLALVVIYRDSFQAGAW